MATSVVSVILCLVLGLLQFSSCQYAVGKDANSSTGFTWCPKRHQQVIKKALPFQLCQPMSCAEMADNSTAPENVLVFEEFSTRYQCQPFTSSFMKCPKVFLPRGQYALGRNGTLINAGYSTTIQLGSYFLEADRAVICASDDGKPEALETTSLPRSCMPFQVPQDGYVWRSNDTIFVNRINDSVHQGFYKTFDNGSVEQVCYQTEYEVLTCQAVTYIGSKEMTLLPDMSLHTRLIIEVTYPIGQYIMSEDGTFALICVQKIKLDTQSDLSLYLYGVASLISAICLLLALLAHLFFPRLNYHTKALLCLAFSLLVMYVVMCVRNFTNSVRFDLTGNIVMFAVQYIFSLSAFLWLNVLAFDLWRVFSNVQGPISPEASQQKGKRWFLLKCVYSYGVPVLMAITIIGISFNLDLQKTLGIFFDFENHNWLTKENIAILVIFYGPILIILISNATFFGLTIKNIRKASSGADILHKDKRAKMQLLKVYIKLFIIMGLSWFAEVISWFAVKDTSETAWYVSDLINCLQGVLIFLVYVCKKKTIKVIKDRFNMITMKGDSNASKSTPLSTPKSRKTSNISFTSVYRSTDTLQ